MVLSAPFPIGMEKGNVSDGDLYCLFFDQQFPSTEIFPSATARSSALLSPPAWG